MVEIFCVCGEWKQNDRLQWDFVLDTNRGSSIFDFDEDLKQNNLLEMVLEDFEIDSSCQTVKLSYGLPLKMRLVVENSPPVFLKNDRQLKAFINIIKSGPEIIPLYVTVTDRDKNLAPENIGCNIQSRTICIEEICGSNGSNTLTSEGNKNTCSGVDVLRLDLDPHPTHVCISKTVNGDSHVDVPFTHGSQQIQHEFRNDIPACSTAEVLRSAPDLSPSILTISNPCAELYVNRHFKNKDELMLQMRKWALEWKFEFKSLWSNKKRVILGCVDPNCTWIMRATKLNSSDFFVVRKYVHGHTCDTTHRHANHRQASAKLLGTLICSNYGEKKYGLKPMQIMEQVRHHHGVHIGYKQAWRVKEYAQDLIRGTPEDSYHNLSKWLFKVNEKNPGSKVYLEMEPNGKFKYTFLSFGQSIRGFDFMRRVIAVDGTFLKGKFTGTLLGASAQDGNYSLYPLAFGIVDTENELAWTWFFRGLKTVVPDASDLVFVSDRASAIANALSVVYPLAHHGICRVHLIRNITPTYGKTGLLPLVEAAADAYTRHEFNLIFSDIKSKSPKLADYLERSDFAKWARCYAPSNRYNIMTTNIAESLNSMLNLARELPIVSLLETIRLTLTTWFHERREKASKHNKLVTPRVVKVMLARYDSAMKLDVFQVDQYEFEVKDETRKYIVHLANKQCTCLVFDIERIPCVHAIAAAKRTNKDENKYVDEMYLTETWSRAYADSIHPSGDLTTCNFPDSVSEYSCAPPTTKKNSGRPPKKRKRSVGEFGVPGSKSQGHKCSRCSRGGHNKSTCKSPI